MESYGANCIYMTDSAGYLLPDDVKRPRGGVRAAKPETEIGFHGHHNLAMGVPTPSPPSKPAPTASTPPAQAWAPGPATRPWKCWSPCATAWASKPAWCVQDPGRGRRPGGADHGLPDPHRPRRADLGYAGVYGSFLLFAKRAEKYGVSAREILVELGRRGMVGGQEDMIEDTAMTLARQRKQA
jgi:4-hydroxy-2-oxovalerate/4-hydroxy-2-oxohexanoate aldolase